MRQTRPEPGERTFHSAAVEATILALRERIADDKLRQLFENCFPNTLDTTVLSHSSKPEPDTFIITGDIPDMWLRDSVAQVWPYLPLIAKDKPLRQLFAGLIRRQVRCIRIDPYANAFNEDATAPSRHHTKDGTDMRPGVAERKWELDSLCYFLRLSHGYWATTGDTSPFGAAWREAVALVLRTFREQQRYDGDGPYRFERVTRKPMDTSMGNGYGNPARPCGMIASGFRPSDDGCIFPFLVPSNLFAVVELRHAGRDYIWHLGIIMQALTATEAEEIAACLRLLATTDADTGYMHERFHKDDPTQFARPWFAWANSLFGELVMHLNHTYPEFLASTSRRPR